MVWRKPSPSSAATSACHSLRCFLSTVGRSDSQGPQVCRLAQVCVEGEGPVIMNAVSSLVTLNRCFLPVIPVTRGPLSVCPQGVSRVPCECRCPQGVQTRVGVSGVRVLVLSVCLGCSLCCPLVLPHILQGEQAVMLAGTGRVTRCWCVTLHAICSLKYMT